MLLATYKTHGVWAVLKQVEDQLQGFTEKSDDRFADLQKKAQFLRWTLEKSDPLLLSNQELTNIQNHLQNVINHIPNNANNWAHHSHIEGFFSQVFQIIPYPRIQKLFKTDVNAFIDNCAKRVDEAIGDADTKVEELSVMVTEKDKYFLDQEKSLQEALASSKGQLSYLTDELEALNTTVDAQFENWETRLDTKIKVKLGELSETFTEGQSKRRDEHEKLLNEIAESLRAAQSNTDSMLSANKKQITDTKQVLKTMSDKITDDAKDLLLKINQIYGIAGNNALSGDFSKTAFREGIAYYIMTTLAAIFYVAIPASFAYLWITYIDVGEFSFSNLLSRLPISLVFLAPALYFGNLAQKHRRVSIAFRSLGMRIATFDAYLANFADVDKNEEKKKMASVFFDTGISAERKSDTTLKDVGKALDQMSGPMEKMAKFFAGKSS